MCNAFTDGNLIGGMSITDHLLESTRCFSYIKVPYDGILCKHFGPACMFASLLFSCSFRFVSTFVALVAVCLGVDCDIIAFYWLVK